MAKLPRSAVVLRFRLGQGLVKARQRYEDTSRSILENVAVTYANDAFDDMKIKLTQRVEADVRAELTHLALLFRRHIIGAAGTRGTPSGSLDTVAKGADAPYMPIASGLPSWAPRNAKYLRAKRAATGGIQWFDNSGWTLSAGRRHGWRPHRTGLLFDEMRADTWEAIFGPINVRFFRNKKPDAHARAGIKTTTDRKVQVQIGTLQVRALGRIEPSMLPGYTSGNIRASASGNPGLMGLIGRYDKDLAYRLGTMNNGIYRPTLEPFLGFFLTQALPHAVNERIKKSTLGSIIRA